MTQTAAQHESANEHLLRRLQESREHYLSALAEVPADAAGFRPAEDRWTILEVAEHVALAERGMLALWTKLAQTGQGDRDRDAAVAAWVANRADKQTAPERSRPSGKYPTLAEARDGFVSNRAQSIAFVESHGEELRGKTVDHPLAGKLDGYQLFLLMAGHAERHAAQIAELKQGFQEKSRING